MSLHPGDHPTRAGRFTCLCGPFQVDVNSPARFRSSSRPGNTHPTTQPPRTLPGSQPRPQSRTHPPDLPDTDVDHGVIIMAWSTSDRRHRLPKDWPTIVSRIKTRDQHRCQASRHDPRCDGRGTDVDHIIQGDDHSDDNLQLLNEHCHRAKTAAETAARNKLNAKLRRRPEEEHPGRL